MAKKIIDPVCPHCGHKMTGLVSVGVTVTCLSCCLVYQVTHLGGQRIY